MNENESNLGAFLAGFVMGALVGAATALILAPQSGQATREKLSHLGGDLRQASEDQIDRMRNSADTYGREYRDMASSILADTRTRAQNLADQAQGSSRIVLDPGRDQSPSAGGLANGSPDAPAA